MLKILHSLLNVLVQIACTSKKEELFDAVFSMRSALGLHVLAKASGNLTNRQTEAKFI
jgi:hypothetical protein